MSGTDNCLDKKPWEEPLPQKLCEKDFKSYFTLLGKLTLKASNNATSYATFSPLLKEHMALSQRILGKYQLNCKCYEATLIYIKLLKTFLRYDAEKVYDLYANWSAMLPSFTATTRAEIFVANIRSFKCVVENMQNASNRRCQLNILSILLLYTTEVSAPTIKAMHLADGPEFLEVIHKIVLLPRDHETALRANNTLLVWINSKSASVLSFQPYKIVCRKEAYILTDYELWVDWNVCTKVISFAAISVTTDKGKSLYGVASATLLKIISRQDDLLIRSKWCLNRKANSKGHKKEIEFCFSARVHNEILQSNLKNVFEIVSFNRKVPPRKTSSSQAKHTSTIRQSHSLKTAAVEPVTGQSAQFSINEVKLVELEKPTNSTTSAKYRNEKSVEEVQDIADTIDSQTDCYINTSEYFAQSSTCHAMAAENTIDRQIKRKYRKRRIDLKEGSSSDSWSGMFGKIIRTKSPEPEEQLLVTAIPSEVPKMEPATTVLQMEIPPCPSVQTDQINQNDARHINNSAILLAADDVLRTLGHWKGQNFDENVQTDCREASTIDPIVETKTYIIQREKKDLCETKKCVESTSLPQRSVDLKTRFNKKEFDRNWSIRKFVKTLRMQPDYGSEIENCDMQSVVDEMDVDVHYGSVSNP